MKLRVDFIAGSTPWKNRRDLEVSVMKRRPVGDVKDVQPPCKFSTFILELGQVCSVRC